MFNRTFELLASKQLRKFIYVGLLNTLVGYSLFAFFIYLEFAYPLAILYSTILGVLFNYKTIGKLVFSHSGPSKLFQFVSVYVVIYILNVGGIWGFELIGLENKYMSGFLLLAPLALLSYVLNKKYVFN